MRATATSLRRASLRSRKAAVAGATAAGLLVAGGGAALAANPPTGPGNVEIFSKRDMVAIEGYTGQAGETATFTLKRGDRVVGTASGVVDDTGFLEVNHPGGVCWDGVTPDVRGGDLLEVSFSETEFVEGAHVGDVVITNVQPQLTETETEDPNDIEGYLIVTGTYGDFVDPARFGVEVVNPDMRGREGQPTRILERAIGWPSDDVPAGYTTEGVIENGTFTVKFGFYSHYDVGLAEAGEQVALSWLAEPANGAEAQLGLTMYEFKETGGPGFGGCPAGPSAQAPDAPLNLSASGGGPGTGTITATWDPANLPADAGEVSRYELRAKDPEFAGQETVANTEGNVTSATLNRLVEQPHQLRVIAYNAAGASVASDEITVDPASTATVPVAADPDATNPDAGVVDEPEVIEPNPGDTGETATAPAAPTGVTATLGETVGEATVSFTAPADNGIAVTGYEVSATTSTEGVTAPPTQDLAADVTTATFTGLVEGASYTFSVVALGAGATEGEVVRSAAATAELTVPDLVAPSAPRVVRVSGGSESAFVEWSAATAGNADTPVTGYRLTATPAAGDPVVLGDIPATATSATITGLTNGTQYTLELVATSAGGNSAPATFANGVSATVTPADVLTATAEFRPDRNEWRLTGTASVTANNTVRAFSDNVQIGNGAAVQADGSWVLRQRNSAARPNAARTIQVTSSAGGTITVPVTVRN